MRTASDAFGAAMVMVVAAAMTVPGIIAVLAVTVLIVKAVKLIWFL